MSADRETHEALLLTLADLKSLTEKGEPADIERRCRNCGHIIKPGATHRPLGNFTTPEGGQFYNNCVVTPARVVEGVQENRE